MGGINAWRRFEPDRFTDEEVKRFNAEWRTAHPAIKRFWYNVDRAALTAVRERGRVVRCGPLLFKSTGAFLLLKLPSGRKLSYPRPRALGDEQRQHVVFADNTRPSADMCDSESCSANVDFEPHSPSPTPKPTLMEHAMGNVPFRPVATGSTTHEAPRAVIRHCHGCYSPLACRVTHRKCVSVPS